MNRLGVILVAFLLMVALVLGTIGCGGGGEGEEATATPTKTAAVTKTPGATATTAPTGAANTLSELIGKAQNVRNVSCDAIMTEPDGTSSTTKIWSKYSGDTWKYKMEGTQDGEVQGMLFDGQSSYMYNATQKTAYKLWDITTMPTVTPGPGAQENESLVEESLSFLQEMNPKYLGTATVDGKSCYVYEYDAGMGYTTKMWIWKDYGFAIKEETTSPEGKSTAEYKNISFSNISDSVFQLPPGTQIQEMPGWGGYGGYEP